MKKVAFWAFLAILVFSLSFSACDSFFSNSWGKFREYDEANIDVNAGNIDEWVSRAVGNPALATIVNRKIDSNLRGRPLDADSAKVLAGRVRLAAQSTGLGASILAHGTTALADIVDNKGTGTAIKNILESIMTDFKANNGPETAKELANLLSDVAINNKASGQQPTFNAEYINVVEASDVAEAIMVLVMAEIANNTISLNNWDDAIDQISALEFVGKKVQVRASGTPTNTQIALASYINLLTDPRFEGKANDNPITKALKDALLS
jgi:hypothetical protein